MNNYQFYGERPIGNEYGDVMGTRTILDYKMLQAIINELVKRIEELERKVKVND